MLMPLGPLLYVVPKVVAKATPSLTYWKILYYLQGLEHFLNPLQEYYSIMIDLQVSQAVRSARQHTYTLLEYPLKFWYRQATSNECKKPTPFYPAFQQVRRNRPWSHYCLRRAISMLYA